MIVSLGVRGGSLPRSVDRKTNSQVVKETQFMSRNLSFELPAAPDKQYYFHAQMATESQCSLASKAGGAKLWLLYHVQLLHM